MCETVDLARSARSDTVLEDVSSAGRSLLKLAKKSGRARIGGVATGHGVAPADDHGTPNLNATIRIQDFSNSTTEEFLPSAPGRTVFAYILANRLLISVLLLAA